MADRVGRGVLVFGVIGLLVAAQLGSLLRVGCFEHDDGLSWFSLPVLVPFAMALLGAIVAALSRPPFRFERALGLTLAVPFVAFLTGATASLVWWPDAVALGASTGLAFGVIALPFVALMALAMRSEARRHSVVDVANRWTTWTVAGSVAAIASVLTLPQWRTYPSCTSDPSQAHFATFLATGIAIFASSALFLHAKRGLHALAMPPRFLDLGVGDAHHETHTHPATAYRDVVETVSVVHGDVAIARRALRTRVLASAVSLVVALACGSAGIILRS